MIPAFFLLIPGLSVLLGNRIRLKVDALESAAHRKDVVEEYEERGEEPADGEADIDVVDIIVIMHADCEEDLAADDHAGKRAEHDRQ